MKVKKAGLLTKLVVLALLAVTAVGLLNLRSQIREIQAEKEVMETKLAEQRQVIADLSDAVDNSDDPDRQDDIARSKLGLLAPGEKVFIYTD